MRIRQKQKLIHEALEDAKAIDITLLDVSQVSDFADLLAIASGTSTRHVSSIADRVVDSLRAHGVRALGIEGKDVGDWVLIDFGDAVVHVMRPPIRDFYNLEKLWSVRKRDETAGGIK
jgi:ribosome-associated protein